MKNSELEIISELTGSSKSTVSKALNHCFGVDGAMRERIITAARGQGIVSERSCSVYAILPDSPVGFWDYVTNRLHDLLMQYGCKINICPRRSSLIFGEYLDEAERLGAGIVLISILPDDEQYKLLLDFSKRVPVIFLFDKVEYENVEIPNTFCISSDAFAEGRELREWSNHANGSVLFVSDGSPLASERKSGFLSRGFPRSITEVRISDRMASASEIAREICVAGKSEFDFIYNLTGQLRETELAAIKLRLRGAVVAGHDYQNHGNRAGSTNINGIDCVYVNRNLDSICRCAADAAIAFVRNRVYPDKKNIYVGAV